MNVFFFNAQFLLAFTVNSALEFSYYQLKHPAVGWVLIIKQAD